MREIDILLGLLVVVAVLATIARRANIPTPILMILGGIAIGFIPGLPRIELAPDIVFLVFLPPLLYVAAFLAPIRDYKTDARAIALLAVGLVLATAAAVAAVARQVIPGLGWAEAIALGAIVAPPDAVAATSILQRIGVPKRVVTILEGESLLNDATALVTLRLAVAAAASGVFSPSGAVLDFAVVGAGGVIVGLLAGLIARELRRRVNDTPVSIMISILTPFAAYLPAEQLGVSGVLATVIAGIVVGRRASQQSSEERVVGNAVWQMIVFILNGLLFTLVGLQLPSIMRSLANVPLPALLVTGGVIALTVVVVRFAWVFPATYLPRKLSRAIARRDPAPPRAAVTIVSWAGLRGAVSLAAALSLPIAFPARDLLIFITFCVIVVTLVGQGLTLPALARRLGLVGETGLEHAETHARAATAARALAALPEAVERWPGHQELIERLQAEYEHRTIHADEHQGEELGAAEREMFEHRQIRQHLIDAEREAILDMHSRGAVSDEVLRRVERDLDLEELRAGL